MTTATQSVLLESEDIARELGVSPVEAKRLIAKRLLPAAKIGEGEYRVTPAALADYVSRGASYVRMPGEYKADDAWFGADLEYLSTEFENSIRTAGEEQAPSDGTMRARFEADKFSTTLEFAIAKSGAVATLANGPVPVSPYALKVENDSKERFLNYGELYGTVVLRRAVRQLLQDRNRMVPLFEQLYKSPEDFDSITMESYDAAAKRSIATSKVLSLPGAPFGVLGSVERRAQFVFALSQILTSSQKARFIALAF